MGYANSVGDFGGLTSYDAHFFFYYLFFLLFAILSPTLINSLDYSKAFSYNQHKEAKKPISVDIAKVKLLRRASFFYTHFGYFHGNGLSSKNSFLSYLIHFPIFGCFHALDEFCKVQLKVFAHLKPFNSVSFSIRSKFSSQPYGLELLKLFVSAAVTVVARRSIARVIATMRMIDFVFLFI